MATLPGGAIPLQPTPNCSLAKIEALRSKCVCIVVFMRPMIQPPLEGDSTH